MSAAWLAGTIAVALAAVPALAQQPGAIGQEQVPPQETKEEVPQRDDQSPRPPRRRDQIRDVLGEVLDAVLAPPPPRYESEPLPEPLPPPRYESEPLPEPLPPPRYDPPPAPEPVATQPGPVAEPSRPPPVRDARPVASGAAPSPTKPSPRVTSAAPAPAPVEQVPTAPPVAAAPVLSVQPEPSPAPAAPVAVPDPSRGSAATPGAAQRPTLLGRLTESGWWPFALVLAIGAAAALAAERYRRRRRLERTRAALALEPRLDTDSGAASCGALEFAGPALAIRCRLETGTAGA